MSAKHRSATLPEMSPMSHGTNDTRGRNVPRDGEDGARVFAGWMLLVVGGLVLANTGVSSAASGVTGSDWSFALLAASSAYLTARGLWSGVRWAWWVCSAYGLAALFFVLPVTAALLFGASTAPVGTGWDVILFPLITAVLVAMLAALWVARPARTHH